MNEAARLIAVLILIGAGWGITQPLSKIAVSTGHGQFGLIFWQMVIGAAFLLVVNRLRGRDLPRGGPQLRMYALIALIGTIIPNTAGYMAIRHLPSGIASILLSMVPMFAFVIALVLGVETFRLRRMIGLGLGLTGVALIVLPGASLPEAVPVIWVFVALITGLSYAVEDNVIAKWGTAGLDPVQLLAGALLIGAVAMLPVAWLSGQMIDPRAGIGAPELALAASAIIHAIVYVTFVWLIAQAGPVFAVQASYLVTGFGIFWAWLILGESYSGYVWAALLFMVAGVALVQPRRYRPKAALAALSQISDKEG